VALADLTLGRFCSVHSLVHALDARTKFFIALSTMGACLYARTPGSFAILYAFLVLAVALSRVPLSYTLKNLRFFIWLLIVAVFLNLFFTEGRTLIHYRYMNISHEGVLAAGVALGRLIFVVMAASLLTLTTQPLDLTEGLSRSLGFLRRLRLPIRELGLMSALSVSYLPVLVDLVTDISMAQRSRGSRLRGRGPAAFRSAAILLVPVVLATLRRADRLALAMEARCFRSANERTSLTLGRMGLSDKVALLLTIGVVCAAVLLGR
jgi:energy-coupling factor transport system permease protein